MPRPSVTTDVVIAGALALLLSPAAFAQSAPSAKPGEARPAVNYIPPNGYVAGSCTFKDVPELALTGAFPDRPSAQGAYRVVAFDTPNQQIKKVKAEFTVSFTPSKPYTGFGVDKVGFRIAAQGYDLPGTPQLYSATVARVEVLLDEIAVPLKVAPQPEHGMVFGAVEFQNKDEVRQFLDLLARARSLTLRVIGSNGRLLGNRSLDVTSFAKVEDLLRRSQFRCT